MATHDSIGEYCPDVEVWLVYAERLEHYFAANKVVDGSKKSAIHLSVCRPSTYGLIRILASPLKATDFCIWSSRTSRTNFQGGNEEIDRWFIGGPVGTVLVQIPANSTVSDRSITRTATDGKASEISVGSAAPRHSIQDMYPSRAAEEGP